MSSGNYQRAIKLFETLEARYPYGRYAQQAILEGAYANYRTGETATAVAAADRFIRTYPNHPNVDYAYYLKGLVHFREDQGLIGYVYETDLSERDPKAMRESFSAFKELAAKFPESRYADDANYRMRYLANALGQYEVHVARYYYNRGAYVAAANRAQAALVNYPKVPANEEALELLVRSYEKMGLDKLAEDTRRILQSTFPKSRYIAGEPAKPWWKFW
jgi:outer membrane protein assembly factor BamD